MRNCDMCGAAMRQGFVIDAGTEYLCETCHPKRYTPEAWAQEYADGESESYWTEWEGGVCRECGGAAYPGEGIPNPHTICWDCVQKKRGGV